ncbi:uncharacterized protein LOC107609183 isoform X9 [Arachis ipaensis]|uniref:uncharacterized protein LOC107609183 isoform X9 n=1 Tax=Arachis ipaensis TaxID=130454 RepID=UPI000A2B2AD6|nr:uncharacterized protein LOC107609183 isoform X9 [Arachis ipaensis]XP_020963694.1 uncharacterized protein LOC107609183 isoform X9 [Arachis ipaensis]
MCKREKLMDSVCSEFQGKLNILFQYFLNDPLNYDLKYYIRLFILPNLEPYLLLLEPEMQPEKQRNETKRQEACVLLDNVCMKGPKSSAICSLLQHVLLLDPMEKP